MIERFIDYLRAQVGRSIYVWGAQGETNITEAWIRKAENNDEKQIKRVLALWNKLKVQGVSPIAAYDCSGLLVCWMLQNKLISGDMSSRGFYAACKKLDRNELKAGDLVFRHNGDKIHHVGIYVGNNNVIECIGRDYGVVERDINASGSSYWNRYGRFPALANTAAPEKDKPRSIQLKKPYMKGEDVLALQKALVSMGYETGGLDGIFGPKSDAALKLFFDRAQNIKHGVCDEAMRLLLGL